MNELQKLFSRLDNPRTPKNEARELLHAYLIRQVERRRRNPDRQEVIAYEIAGLLSAYFVTAGDDQDPYVQILEMAGRLEVPESHHGTATWKEFEARVRALPKNVSVN